MSDGGMIVKLVLENGEMVRYPASDAASWDLMMDIWNYFDRPKLEQQPEQEDRLKLLVE